MSPWNEFGSLSKSEHHVIDPTNPGGALDDSVEDRLHVGGRAADDSEHFRSRRLVLQSLAQLCVPFPQLLEQSHVFNCDYRLVGKNLEQSDLLFGKWADFGATDCDDTYRDPFSKQRRDQYGANATNLNFSP
jgi:hypothetical protein